MLFLDPVNWEFDQEQTETGPFFEKKVDPIELDDPPDVTHLETSLFSAWSLKRRWRDCKSRDPSDELP